MKKRTVSIGGATYDVFMHLESNTIASTAEGEAFSFLLGSKILSKKVTESCGGGASNTAVGLARLGCDATFAGIVGDDQWGAKLLENLRKEGVDTRSMTVVEDEVSSFSIILTAEKGDRVILYDPGTNEHLHDATFHKEHICQSDWMYLNHIQESSCVIQNDIVEIITGSYDVGLTWNPGGCQIQAGHTERLNKQLLKHTDILLLNREEASIFTQKKDPIDALKALLESGAKYVCITNGSEGTIASDGSTVYACPIVTLGEVVDTTGAGDAFGCGVTAGILQDKDLPTALQMGSMNGASVVSFVGAQAGLLTDTDMHSKMKQVHCDIDARPLSS
jgi:ribokinase